VGSWALCLGWPAGYAWSTVRLVHWPMGRFGTLDEAAGTVAFLASDDAGFITAAALPLDGGITAAFTVPE
jgi:NAD(P)-dependent dehydrogenase (short-subunit alcohol dehydrogenase family)